MFFFIEGFPYKIKLLRRVVLTACGYLQGDWVETMEESRVVTLLEPVTEGVMQLFCQVGAFFVYQRKNNYQLSFTQQSFIYFLLFR